MEDAHNALVDAVRVLDVLDYKAPMVALLQLAAQKYNLPAVEIVTGVRDTRISREQVYIKDEE